MSQLNQKIAQIESFLAKIAGEHRTILKNLSDVQSEYKAFKSACENTPRTITAELDSIPGRRLFYNLNGTTNFTASDDGQRGTAINFLVSQDGPFVMTHYPLVMWKPSAPANATEFGYWRPVSIWPVPTQEAGSDFINLSYELIDGGSQRNFQNSPTVPMFSRPDAMAPLPVPTLFAPNTTIQFVPTYEDIFFDSGVSVATTQGTLAVALPGYRIVNM